VLSSYILGELERVLSYPRLAARSDLGPADISEYLQTLAMASCLVAPSDVPVGVTGDPDDAPILGTVLAGRADVLCTRDAHFFEAKSKEFCSANGILVVTEVELLKKFRS
jgi:predicted nucleic acid-binding protein